MPDAPKNTIPFNRPFIVGRELHNISQAVLQGNLMGDGEFTRSCQQWMEERFDAHKVLLTHSCTGALELCALLADIGPGDEVIMPSYTFVSTANAFVRCGARIRFVDIRPDTLNLDENAVAAAVNEHTRAIVPVHYAGVGCEMDAILDTARAHDLLVIEDAAQGVMATYRDRYLGTIGHLGAYSFHETKNFISGEGGALIVNDGRFCDRAEILREKGTNRKQFFRGEVDRYTWVDVGSSYLPSEIIAAFLYAQLQEAERITAKRWEVFERYAAELAPLAAAGRVRFLQAPEHCRHNAHMFYLIAATAQERDALLAHLQARGIGAVFHYVPLHSSPMGRKVGVHDGPLPRTDDLSARLLRLPCYYDLTPGEQSRVIAEVLAHYADTP